MKKDDAVFLRRGTSQEIAVWSLHFALKYEAVNLTVVKALFNVVQAEMMAVSNYPGMQIDKLRQQSEVSI